MMCPSNSGVPVGHRRDSVPEVGAMRNSSWDIRPFADRWGLPMSNCRIFRGFLGVVELRSTQRWQR
jgi:hypothetical protein